MNSEMDIANALRLAAKLASPERLPDVGDIVQVDGQLGICTEYHKGWCYVRALDEEGELTKRMDFISDQERHGDRSVKFIIRDDLRG